MSRITKFWHTLCLVFTILLTVFTGGCAEEHDPILQPEVASEQVSQNDGYEAATVDDETGLRYSYWISELEPYILVNEDQTFVFQQDNFIADKVGIHDDVIAYLEGDLAQVTMDAQIVQQFIDGLEIVNPLNRELYISHASDGSQTYGMWQYYHWWGQTTCFSGGSAQTAKWALCGGTAPFGALSKILGAYFGSLCATADYKIYSCGYGGFCLQQNWAGVAWITC